MKKLILLLSITILFSLDFELPTDLFIDNQPAIQNENNTSSIEEEIFNDNFESSTTFLKVCVLIDKRKFFKYIPSLINSLNSYLIYKNINYSLEIKDINQSIKSCKYVIVYSLNKNKIYSLAKNNSTNFYIPILHRNDINFSKNLFLGGIDFKNQILTLSKFIDDNKSIVINDNTYISNKLFGYEKELNITIKTYTYPKINYYKLYNRYLFLNTSAGKTAQILSNITSKEINTKLQFATQINYDPLLLGITQPKDTQKFLIANSLINIPDIIESFNLVLNTDIKYNWLNYASSILLNKIYNTQTQDDEFYMNDFNIYIFNNQIEYKIDIFQIINGSFKKINN